MRAFDNADHRTYVDLKVRHLIGAIIVSEDSNEQERVFLFHALCQFLRN